MMTHLSSYFLNLIRVVVKFVKGLHCVGLPGYFASRATSFQCISSNALGLLEDSINISKLDGHCQQIIPMQEIVSLM